MSGQITNFGQASILGALCGAVFYRFEQYKLQLGKGGRLGTIAFLSNLIYFVTAVASPQRFLVDVLNLVRPTTAVAAVAASSLAVQTAGNKESSRWQRIVHHASKATLLGVLLARLVSNSSTTAVATLTKFLGSVLTIFTASLVVKKTTPYKGVVMATSVVGLLGSFLPVVSPAAVYLGAFLGMTGLASFGITSFAQASLLSAVLLELGLWNGFGGKLGFLSFLGVHFVL